MEKIILCAIPLKLGSLCNARIKKKMLVENSVSSIPQTADLPPNSRFTNLKFSCPRDFILLFVQMEGQTFLAGIHANCILTSLWKIKTYIGRYTDYAKGEKKNIYLHHLVHISWDPYIMNHCTEFYWGHIWILNFP